MVAMQDERNAPAPVTGLFNNPDEGGFDRSRRERAPYRASAGRASHRARSPPRRPVVYLQHEDGAGQHQEIYEKTEQADDEEQPSALGQGGAYPRPVALVVFSIIHGLSITRSRGVPLKSPYTKSHQPRTSQDLFHQQRVGACLVSPGAGRHVVGPGVVCREPHPAVVAHAAVVVPYARDAGAVRFVDPAQVRVG